MKKAVRDVVIWLVGIILVVTACCIWVTPLLVPFTHSGEEYRYYQDVEGLRANTVYISKREGTYTFTNTGESLSGEARGYWSSDIGTADMLTGLISELPEVAEDGATLKFECLKFSRDSKAVERGVKVFTQDPCAYYLINVPSITGMSVNEVVAELKVNNSFFLDTLYPWHDGVKVVYESKFTQLRLAFCVVGIIPTLLLAFTFPAMVSEYDRRERLEAEVQEGRAGSDD